MDRFYDKLQQELLPGDFVAVYDDFPGYNKGIEFGIVLGGDDRLSVLLLIKPKIVTIHSDGTPQHFIKIPRSAIPRKVLSSENPYWLTLLDHGIGIYLGI